MDDSGRCWTLNIRMLLYVNGCSATWGKELPPNIRENSIWAAIFAKRIGITNINVAAECASSNEKIFRRTMEFVADYLKRGNDPTKLFVLVGWSGAERREFFNTITNEWQSFLPSCKLSKNKEYQQLWEIYYPDFCNIEKNFEKMLLQVISLQNFLKIQKINFYFVSCLGGFRLLVKNPTEIIYNLIQLIDQNHFYGFSDGISFAWWSKQQGYEFGPERHPLSEAHKAWGNLIADQWLSQSI